MSYTRRVFYFDSAGKKHEVFRSMGDLPTKSMAKSATVNAKLAPASSYESVLVLGAAGALAYYLYRRHQQKKES